MYEERANLEKVIDRKFSMAHNPRYKKRTFELKHLPEDYFTPALWKLREEGSLPKPNESSDHLKVLGHLERMSSPGDDKNKQPRKSTKKKELQESSNSNNTDPPQLSLADLNRKIRELQMSSFATRDLQEAQSHKYEFWKTQPVPKLDENVTENTYIEAPIDVSRIRKEPYTLPAQFKWSDIDLNNDAELTELYKLLSDNYVEDDESMFRFDYSTDFFKALLPPGWRKEWHCGVRAINSNVLVAFIAAIPCKMNVRGEELTMVEINFLCVHKSLRSKRVTPVLVREITRRVNLVRIFQAAYTAGVVLPKPITTSRYWHRSLNPKKLIECQFSRLSRNMTLQRTIRYYSLPKQPTLPLIKLESRHIPSAYKLLSDYLKKFLLYPIFSAEEFSHCFTPRDKVIYAYVIEDNDKNVTDLISFYSLPSTVVNHATHKKIEAAYAFYNVATSQTMTTLINEALILARNEGFDVYNALDLMDNKQFVEDLKFGIGDGNLQYYLYNWKSPEMKPEEVGLVLHSKRFSPIVVLLTY
ncbi:Glycylpeptide N-tetradecanoyltransferase [Aphelenchoides besseyi]|nr:Glycylpeptide N-tetradecanoyltransferase [Aphelenchoides besseyi]